jgi:hypothetical protein
MQRMFSPPKLPHISSLAEATVKAYITKITKPTNMAAFTLYELNHIRI